jgi:hypothetical protein
MKFLAVKIDREYVHVEHIQKSMLGINSEATIILTYAVEYSFGFDSAGTRAGQPPGSRHRLSATSAPALDSLRASSA